MNDYPHEFSGGMRQRAVIAMALSCNPALLIADEPTTALDVTIQAQILELMRGLQREHGSAIVIITHDMGVVSEIADRVLVMYGGRAAEQGPRPAVFHDPRHPYTWGLLGSVPRVGGRGCGGCPPSRACPSRPVPSRRGARSHRAAGCGTTGARSGPRCPATPTSTPAGCRPASGRHCDDGTVARTTAREDMEATP